MGLTFIRHTKPDIADGVCYGQLDLPVANTFEAELNTILAQLKQADVLVSSPLQRCRSLASRIGDQFNQDVQNDERLREMNFGRWEGIAWDEISRIELDQWRDDFYQAAPHGGESVATFSNRVNAAIGDYRKTGKSHLIVCHAGVIKVANSQGKTAADFATTVPFGGVFQLPPAT